MLDFMKILLKIAFLGLLTSALSMPSMADSAFAGVATKGSRMTAKLDFSIVVLPSLLLRVRTAAQADTVDTAATVRVEANSGSVSLLSTGAGPAGTQDQATTLAANRKLVRAESSWNADPRHGSMSPVAGNGTHLPRREQRTVTVAQL